MFEAVVVGAGMARFVATHRLLEAGVQVQCFEPRARIGGRAHAGTLRA
ncbi:MAG: NAD(P)-binding protein [Rhodospirillales bacterium]|nr:NAD(P)-binding protein [Rhodospirillales bacterium]